MFWVGLAMATVPVLVAFVFMLRRFGWQDVRPVLLVMACAIAVSVWISIAITLMSK